MKSADDETKTVFSKLFWSNIKRVKKSIEYLLRLMTSPSGECFWARTIEREVASEAVPTVRKRYSEQWASITQGLDVHTRVLEQQVGNTYMLSIYRPT